MTHDQWQQTQQGWAESEASWSANNDQSEIKVDHYQESVKIITKQGWPFNIRE